MLGLALTDRNLEIRSDYVYQEQSGVKKTLSCRKSYFLDG